MKSFLKQRKADFRHWRKYSDMESSLIKAAKAKKDRSGLLIGPANSAGQARAWAAALTQAGHLSHSIRITRDQSAELFTADYFVTEEERKSKSQMVDLGHALFTHHSGYLMESLTPLFGFRRRAGFLPIHAIDGLRLLRRMHMKVGVVFHGSDIRNVDAHVERNKYSPFRQQRPELEALRTRSNLIRAQIPNLDRLGIPYFISTVDLFADAPNATWLPVVIDVKSFGAVAKSSPIFTSQKLRVLYLPSRSWIKSADEILPVLEKLRDEGVIEYKDWLKNGRVDSSHVPDILSQSDVVIDQFIGGIGVFALESLAAGRIVMTYLPEELKKYPHPPVISITPDTLENELRKLAAHRIAPAGGIEFVAKWHSGPESARILIEKLGLD
jgi:hypothetical protein